MQWFASAVSGAVPQAESQRLAHRTPSSGDLLYVMTDVNVFYAVNYSTGKVQTVVYEPSGWGAGDCSDTTGNVYILAAATSSQAGQIFKFAHGGTSPVATLTDKNYYPTGCSIDPTTGSLAVSNDATANCPGGGNVAVYPNAQGSPTIYTDSTFECFLGTAYDNSGNLFVGGVADGSGHYFQLAELPRGGSTLTNVSLNEQIPCRPLDGTCKNSIQWDGNDIVVTVPMGKHSPVLYRVSVSSSNGTVVGTTTFKGKWASKASGPLRVNAAVVSWLVLRVLKTLYYPGPHVQSVAAAEGLGRARAK